ncbi:MAG: carbohydrate kinase family protein [Gemmatimonadota bacterium]|nr:carbohydrate kinase family protein [Gemmatimonadota bacterium]
MPRLGVVGTMVWDTIHASDGGEVAPVAGWGGIAYALAAAEAALPEDWTILPIIKVGADLREPVDRFLDSLGRVESLDGVLTVPEANNRVELFYHTAGRRCERLTGGVPGWSAEEILPLARSCDALYVNFIAGWELELATATAFRAEVEGPLYCDLHSLMLGVHEDGMRALRPLESWRAWLSAFDVVQLNEDELLTLADGREDPWTLPAEAVDSSTRAVLVTLGARGAAWVAAPGFGDGGDDRPPGVGEPTSATLEPGRDSAAGGVRSGRVEPETTVDEADPTGCGDVWGATCFASLLSGDSLDDAMRSANRAAGRNAAHRGATGLSEYLVSSTGLVTGGRST